MGWLDQEGIGIHGPAGTLRQCFTAHLHTCWENVGSTGSSLEVMDEAAAGGGW